MTVFDDSDPISPENSESRGLQRLALLTAGYGLFAIGWAGLFLPLLPTTVFWIGAALCFTRSCPAMRERLFAWPGIGPGLRSFVEQGALSRRAKLLALSGMTAAGALSALALRDQPLLLAALLLTLATGAIFASSRPRP